MNTIKNINCLLGLKELPDNSVDCCVTSPPYFGLRDYGTKDQIGLESTPEAFVAALVEVFMEVKRVLKNEGTLWLNLGDSYASAGKNRTEEQANAKSTLAGSQSPILKQQSKITGDLKAKDLIGIPWMVAFALRSAGWYLRQDIIWHKPNPMPESVTDRCTKSHEYIFLLSKSAKYYYDAESIKTLMVEHSFNPSHFSDGTKKEVLHKQRGLTKPVFVGGNKHKNLEDKGLAVHTMHRTRNSNGQEYTNESGQGTNRLNGMKK